MLTNLMPLLNCQFNCTRKLGEITITLAFLLFIGVSVVLRRGLAGKGGNYPGLAT